MKQSTSMRNVLIESREWIFRRGIFWADREIDYVFVSKEVWARSKRKLRKAQAVIDLGCGPGTLLYNLSKECGGETLGLDLSKEKCFYARLMSPKSDVIRADTLRTPFKDGVFDMVYSSQLIEHVDDTNMIREVKRILKENGTVVLGTIFRQKDSPYPINPEHQREYTFVNQLIEPLNKAGFNIEMVRITSVKYSPLDKVFKFLYDLTSWSIFIELPKYRIICLLRRLSRINIPIYYLEFIAQKIFVPNVVRNSCE